MNTNTLNNISGNFARRVDWEDDLFMAQKSNGTWFILSPRGIMITDADKRKRQALALNSDKWASCNVYGEFN